MTNLTSLTEYDLYLRTLKENMPHDIENNLLTTAMLKFKTRKNFDSGNLFIRNCNLNSAAILSHSQIHCSYRAIEIFDVMPHLIEWKKATRYLIFVRYRLMFARELYLWTT